MKAIQKADAALTRAERIFSGVAGAMLFGTMLVVVADVGLRYFFHAPLTWSYDLVSLYLMVGIFFFALSDTLQHEEHVCVDLLHKYMSRRMRHFVETLGHACGVVVFAAIVCMTMGRTIHSFQASEVSPGAIPWPMWLSAAAVPLGAGLMLLRMVYRLAGHLASLFTEQSLVELPPLAGAEKAV